MQKIKADLIHKAKVKKSYAKVKAEELASAPTKSIYDTVTEDQNEDGEGKSDEPESTGLELHPDRQAMVEAADWAAEVMKEREEKRKQNPEGSQAGRRRRRPKPAPFAREISAAQKRKAEIEARRKQREIKEKDRQAMARARRPDQFGKRRLGRESKVLLDRVKRMVGEQ